MLKEYQKYIENKSFYRNTPKMIESTYGHIIDSAKRDVSDAFSKILSEEVSEAIPFNAQSL